MSTVDFLPFATGVAANVVDQASYSVSSYVINGYASGIANSAQLNKTWRQSSFMAAVIANWISLELSVDVLDDGNLAAMVTKLQNAVVIGAGIKNVRVVNASANLNILASDYRVAFQRIASPAVLTATLPALPDSSFGQSFKLGDIQSNAGTFPITVVPQSGQSIGSKANYVIAFDNQWAEFCYVAHNTWSVEI